MSSKSVLPTASVRRYGLVALLTFVLLSIIVTGHLLMKPFINDSGLIQNAFFFLYRASFPIHYIAILFYKGSDSTALRFLSYCYVNLVVSAIVALGSVPTSIRRRVVVGFVCVLGYALLSAASFWMASQSLQNH